MPPVRADSPKGKPSRMPVLMLRRVVAGLRTCLGCLACPASRPTPASSPFFFLPHQKGQLSKPYGGVIIPAPVVQKALPKKLGEGNVHYAIFRGARCCSFEITAYVCKAGLRICRDFHNIGLIGSTIEGFLWQPFSRSVSAEKREKGSSKSYSTPGLRLD